MVYLSFLNNVINRSLVIAAWSVLSFQVIAMEDANPTDASGQLFFTSDQDIKRFISYFNDLQSRAELDREPYLKLVNIDGSTHQFTAHKCWSLNCKEPNESISEVDFKLFYADVNNDGHSDYTLVSMRQGRSQDVVEGVFTMKNQVLNTLPFQETIIRSLGESQLRDWPAFIESPFLSKKNNQIFFHFIDLPIYKNSKGEQVFTPHSVPADYSETRHLEYLWSNNEIKQTDVKINIRYLDQSGP